VCTLTDDEQDAWLECAAANGWSRNRLRRELRCARTPCMTAQVFRLAVDPDRADRWREAARRCDCGCNEWIVRVLDEAARPRAPAVDS
jgi:hypothetical protein